jgi:hypothetical protein
MLGANDSEKLWRLDLDGRPLDPKFDLEAQFVWGQAMGATQFHIYQLVTETWGRSIRVVSDGSGVVFDLFDPDKSLPILLEDFSVNLQFARAFYEAKAAAAPLVYPCVDVPGSGNRCLHQEWNDWVVDMLKLYNSGSTYPNAVFRWLAVSAGNPAVAFGGNVGYAGTP